MSTDILQQSIKMQLLPIATYYEIFARHEDNYQLFSLSRKMSRASTYIFGALPATSLTTLPACAKSSQVARKSSCWVQLQAHSLKVHEPISLLGNCALQEAREQEIWRERCPDLEEVGFRH